MGDSMKMPVKKYWRELDTKGKFKYFFQYYKWYVLAVLFVLILGYITVQQLSNSVKYDFVMIVMGDHPIKEADQAAMKQSIVPYLTDVTGDGKAVPNLLQLTYQAQGSQNYNYDANTGNDVNFNLQTSLGYPIILILSPSEYKRITSGEFGSALRNLKSLTDRSADGKSVPIKNTKLHSLSGFNAIPDDYVVCMIDKTVNLTYAYANNMQKETETVFSKLVG